MAFASKEGTFPERNSGSQLWLWFLQAGCLCIYLLTDDMSGVLIQTHQLALIVAQTHLIS